MACHGCAYTGQPRTLGISTGLGLSGPQGVWLILVCSTNGEYGTLLFEEQFPVAGAVP